MSEKENRERVEILADMAVDTVISVLEDKQQFNRYIVEHKDGSEKWQEERVFDKVDTKALKDIISVVKDLTEIVQTTGGTMPNKVEVAFDGQDVEEWCE